MAAPCQIRTASNDHHDRILTVLKLAFEQDDEAKLVEKLWSTNVITMEHVALIDKKVVGYCAYSDVTSNPPLSGHLLGLAPLAVDPKHQGTGIGAALVEFGLNACRAKNAAIVVVLGEPHYYKRFGFEPASRKNMAWDELDAGDAFQVLDLLGVADGQSRVISYNPAFTEN